MKSNKLILSLIIALLLSASSSYAALLGTRHVSEGGGLSVSMDVSTYLSNLGRGDSSLNYHFTLYRVTSSGLSYVAEGGLSVDFTGSGWAGFSSPNVYGSASDSITVSCFSWFMDEYVDGSVSFDNLPE